MDIYDITCDFASELDALNLKIHDVFIYNPLSYAKDSLFKYFGYFADHELNTVYLGMNPGPYGMLQTGIPFGAVDKVRQFLDINDGVKKPQVEHPFRPITGFETKRNEVSGARLWSLFEAVYKTRENFFLDNAVLNYCPLAFLSEDKRAANIALDKIGSEDRCVIERVCDKYLDLYLMLLKPKVLVGIGQYAYKVLSRSEYKCNKVFSIPHPSPANPKANVNWIENTIQVLKSEGVFCGKTV